MEKTRIQVYADEKTKRRVELAATKYNMAVTEYCLSAIRQQLAEDDLLERDEVALPVVPELEENLIDALQTLQNGIKSRRKGKPIDVDGTLDALRAERDREIMGLR